MTPQACAAGDFGRQGKRLAEQVSGIAAIGVSGRYANFCLSIGDTSTFYPHAIHRSSVKLCSGGAGVVGKRLSSAR